jgi:phenylalanyl-tRNA synthetase alpha chain
MATADYLAELDALLSAATERFAAAEDAAALEAARVEFLGAKSGRIKSAQKGLGVVAPADRPVAGKKFHAVRAAIEAAFAAATEKLKSRPQSAVRSVPQFDPTVPGRSRRLGRLHPITQTIVELREIMGRLGFTEADGPEVEDQWHNFEALNIPIEHPARDPLENFYLDSVASGQWPVVSGQKVASGEWRVAKEKPRPKTQDPRPKTEIPKSRNPEIPPSPVARPPSPGPFLLRSQTSTVQIRVMERRRPPVRIISCGRVYRPDTPDATPFPMFHQMEGLLVDRGVTMADLKSTLRLFARSALSDDVHIRFRPSFFPFTEPSVEVDMSWGEGWIEMGGAGMVDPNVLRAVGYDPEEFSGFAFGLGIERICARRHGIADIRDLFRNDVRFLRQF